MKKFVFLFAMTLLISPLALAKEADKIVEEKNITSPTEYTFAGHTAHAYLTISYSRGGFVPGGALEYSGKGSIGYGGYFHNYKKDLSKGAIGVTTIGAFMAPHLDHGKWDCYFVTGLAIQKISSATTDETGFGPAFGVGVLYHYIDGIAIGMEKLDHFDWITKEHKGRTVSDVILKLRYSFD